MLRRNVIGASLGGAGAVGAACHAAPSAPVADAAMQGDTRRGAGAAEAGADVNGAQGDGMTALHWAAMKDDAELAQTAAVRRRQRARDDADRRATRRCILAAKNGSADGDGAAAQGRRRRQRARPSNGTTPLMLAAASGSVDAVSASPRRTAPT